MCQLHHSGKKGQGTLWDQEKDELAVRILLEEGKMNLVLRVLHRYSTASRSASWPATLQSTAERFKSELSTVVERCRVFEQSVGVLLKYVMLHIEALQIIDQPEFITHATEVIADAQLNPSKLDGADADKMQSTLVIHYLASLSAQFDELDEERLMDLIEERGLFPTFTSYLQQRYTQHSIATLMQASYALNNLIASDPYQTEPTRFLGKSKEGSTTLVALKGLFVQELVAKYGMKKAGVQSLLDEMQRLERVVGEAKQVPLKVRGSGVEVSSGKQEETKEA